jgi:glucokinase
MGADSMHYLGIEIGGTKLQLGIGAGDGVLAALWRGPIEPAAGPDGIRRQITEAVPDLLSRSGIARKQLRAVGVGFGGPVDDARHTIIKSHQIDGWDDVPLADWISGVVGLPTALGNDADVAGLAEALHGAGKGLTPVFYITIGSGIGGGLIIDGNIHRGCGRGAAEIGHLRVWHDGRFVPLELVASGWSIARRASSQFGPITPEQVADLADQGEASARAVLYEGWSCLAEAICHVIALTCPRCVVIGGGVALMGEKLLFEPLRRMVAERVFAPFAGLTDIVPAALGEEMVVHGAIELARRLSRTPT